MNNGSESKSSELSAIILAINNDIGKVDLGIDYEVKNKIENIIDNKVNNIDNKKINKKKDKKFEPVFEPVDEKAIIIYSNLFIIHFNDGSAAGW